MEKSAEYNIGSKIYNANEIIVESKFFNKLGTTLTAEYEEKFLASSNLPRRKKFVIAILMALAVYNAFLLYDYIIRPDMLKDIMYIRLLYTTAPCLLLTYGLPKLSNVTHQELFAATGVLISTLGISAINLKTTGGYAAADAMTFPLVIVVINAMLPFRLKMALPVNVIVILIFSACLWLHKIIPSESKNTAIVVLIATSVYTLFAVARNEKNDRINFLHQLLEEDRLAEISRINSTLFKMARTDSLSGLYNRRYFDEQFEKILTKNMKSGGAVGLIMFDVDRFKWYNDTFGHQMGDVCLRQVATAADSVCTNSGCLLARIGGEEFAIIVEHKLGIDAISIAEEVRSAIVELAIPHVSNVPQGIVTVSLGVTVIAPYSTINQSETLRAADEALYIAKNSGRNRVAVVPLQ